MSERAFIWTFYYEDGTSERIIDPPMTYEECEAYIKEHSKNGKHIYGAWPQFCG
jgi:hypothetical protein